MSVSKKKIAVLFGGCSTEYDVSLVSAHAVLSNIDSNLFEAIPIGISRAGEWFRYYGDIENIVNDKWFYNKNDNVKVMIAPGKDIHGIIEVRNGKISMTSIDAAFPVLHGKNGEDGSVQSVFKLAGIPIIGCGILASALCMDKARAKKLVEYAGIKSAAFVVIKKHDLQENNYDNLTESTFPVFVKPVKSGSSIGITKVYEKEDLIKAINKAFVHDDEVIIEENVEGVEVGCAVLGKDMLITGEVDEIELCTDWFDYHEKYTQTQSTTYMPARFDIELSNKIKIIAQNIYKTLGCSGFARVDMFLTKDKEILFNEVNTIPGFTSNSRFPQMMRGTGYEFPRLINEIISAGVFQETTRYE